MFSLFSRRKSLEIPRPPRLRSPEVVSWVRVPRMRAEILPDKTLRAYLDKRYLLPDGRDVRKIAAWFRDVAQELLNNYPYRMEGLDCDDIANVCVACRCMLYPTVEACPVIGSVLIPGHVVVGIRATDGWWLTDSALPETNYREISSSDNVTDFYLH